MPQSSRAHNPYLFWVSSNPDGNGSVPNFLRGFWSHRKTFFFTLGLILIVVGFLLTQIRGLGEERFVVFWPAAGIKVTATQAIGYSFIGIGLVSWMAVVGSLIVSSEER